MDGAAVRIPRRYLTTQQVAQIFGVSQITVGNWIRWGLLPALRVGRGPYYIDPAILPTFDPPRGNSHAWFNRELFDAITGGESSG